MGSYTFVRRSSAGVDADVSSPFGSTSAAPSRSRINVQTTFPILPAEISDGDGDSDSNSWICSRWSMGREVR